MLRIILNISFLSMAFSSATLAQKAPGYLGKRLAISYQANLAPSVWQAYSPEIDFYNIYDGPQNEGVGLNYKHQLNLDYAYAKKNSIGGYVSFFQSYFGNNVGQFFEGGSLPSDATVLEEFIPLRVMEIGASYKIYGQQLAPLGSFFNLRLGIISQSFDDVDLSLWTPSNTINGAAVEEKRSIDGNSSLGLNLGLGWGVNRIVADRVLISYGVQFNFAYQFDGTTAAIFDISEGDHNFLDPSETDEAIQDKLSSKATIRTFGFNIFQFSIAVGILP